MFLSLSISSLFLGLSEASAFSFNPSYTVDFSNTSGFSTETLPITTNGWGEKEVTPLYEVGSISKNTLYRLPENIQLPNYFIEPQDNETGIANFENYTLRFDIPIESKSNLISFLTLKHQNESGRFKFDGGSSGNLEIRYSSLNGVRMFWLSTEESQLDIQASNVWLQFDTSDKSEHFFEGAGSVTINTVNDLVLFLNQQTDSKMQSIINGLASSNYELTGQNIYFLANGDSLNTPSYKGVAGIDFSGEHLTIGTTSTNNIIFEGLDQAIRIYGNSYYVENEEYHTVSDIKANNIVLLGKGTTNSFGLSLDGIQDFNIHSNAIHISNYSSAIVAQNNAYAFINTKDLNIDGLMKASADSLIDIKTDTATIHGDIVAENAATFSLIAKSKVIFTGSTHSEMGWKEDEWVSLTLSMGDQSLWTLTNDSDLNNLTLSNSVLDLSSVDKNISLAIKDKFSGTNNTFILWSNLLDNEISNLEINKTENAGVQFIGIKDVNEAGLDGINISPTKFATVTTNGNLSFEPITTLSEHGLTMWNPQIFSKDETDGSTSWFISQIIETPGPTPTAMLDGFQNNYLFWRTLTDSTKERFGQLRHGQSAGVWGRVTAGSLSQGDLTNDYQTYRLGADTSIQPGLSLGAMFEIHEGDLDTSNGKGDMQAITAAIYGLYVSPSGYYADAGFRFGVMDYEYKNTALLYDEYDYNSSAVGAWLEVGKEWAFANNYTLTPHLAVNFGRFGTEHFTSDNGLKAKVDSVNSVIFTVGTDVGYKTETFEVSAVADLMTEVAGSQDIRISHNAASLTRSADYSDTWMEFGLSASYRPTDETLLWVNGRRSAFADLDNDWRINAGVRWSFY